MHTHWIDLQVISPEKWNFASHPRLHAYKKKFNRDEKNLVNVMLAANH